MDQALLLIGVSEFSATVGTAVDLPEATRLLVADQERARQLQFPLLKALTPKRAFDVGAATQLNPDEIAAVQEAIELTTTNIAAARIAFAAIQDAAKLIVGPVRQLIEKGLLDEDVERQECPLCEAGPTLTKARLSEILAIKPLTDVLAKTEREDEQARRKASEHFERIRTLLAELAPEAPDEAAWTNAMANAGEVLRVAATIARPVCTEVFEALKPLRSRLDEIIALLEPGPMSGEDLKDKVVPCLAEMRRLLPLVETHSLRIGGVVTDLKSAVGVQASGSVAYARRESWLKLANGKGELRDDLAWEGAKKDAQKRLEGARAALIGLRQAVLESRRKAFSDGMLDVWSTLRGDTYSRFKDLHIPTPSGKGYPVAIQVRASLDDGKQTIDVDALRVFSESQVNVLGIAAFLTRTRGIGHSMVILDDPVQSMDEEHFRTMAGPLITGLLDDGLQVIVLTHNDTFARDVSWAHTDRAGYVTLLLRNSRRKGCTVQEGNRKVPERLKRAEEQAEEGDLKGAWVTLRLALERLYTIVQAKSDPKFEPRTWAGLSAEAMWNMGVGIALESAVPDSPKRLKDILDCTAAGAHDKPPRGETDVRIACSYIRTLLGPLRVGG